MSKIDMNMKPLYTVSSSRRFDETKKEFYITNLGLYITWCENEKGKFVILSEYKHSHNRYGYIKNRRHDVFFRVNCDKTRGNEIYKKFMSISEPYFKDSDLIRDRRANLDDVLALFK